jgi:hypothetical protein
MKTNKTLYIIIACLMVIIVGGASLIGLSYNRNDDFELSNKTSSTKSLFNTDDTGKLLQGQQLTDTVKENNVDSNATNPGVQNIGALNVTYEELYPNNELGNTEDTFKVVGVIINIENDVASIKETGDLVSQIKFDFSHITIARKDELKQHLKAGREIYAVCTYLDGLQLVNSFRML